MCICCQELACRPITTKCSHNICKVRHTFPTRLLATPMEARNPFGPQFDPLKLSGWFEERNLISKTCPCFRHACSVHSRRMSTPVPPVVQTWAKITAWPPTKPSAKFSKTSSRATRQDVKSTEQNILEQFFQDFRALFCRAKNTGENVRDFLLGKNLTEDLEQFSPKPRKLFTPRTK